MPAGITLKGIAKGIGGMRARDISTRPVSRICSGMVREPQMPRVGHPKLHLGDSPPREARHPRAPSYLGGRKEHGWRGEGEELP